MCTSLSIDLQGTPQLIACKRLHDEQSERVVCFGGIKPSAVVPDDKSVGTAILFEDNVHLSGLPGGKGVLHSVGERFVDDKAAVDGSLRVQCDIRVQGDGDMLICEGVFYLLDEQ